MVVGVQEWAWEMRIFSPPEPPAPRSTTGMGTSPWELIDPVWSMERLRSVGEQRVVGTTLGPQDTLGRQLVGDLLPSDYPNPPSLVPPGVGRAGKMKPR